MKLQPGNTETGYRESLSQASARLRLVYTYRRMILLGKAQPPWEIARRLVGPDSAFHLYGRSVEGPSSPRRPPRSRGKSKRARR